MFAIAKKNISFSYKYRCANLLDERVDIPSDREC